MYQVTSNYVIEEQTLVNGDKKIILKMEYGSGWVNDSPIRNFFDIVAIGFSLFLEYHKTSREIYSGVGANNFCEFILKHVKLILVQE